jgi:C4-dicarboxylate-specific signal transduction histidine kinase
MNAAVLSSDQVWRDLSYDVAWEATSSGTIRCCTVLNRRNDISQAVEGLDLSAIRCESRGKTARQLLEEGDALRHVEVRLPKLFGPERLYITARRLGNERTAGTFCAIDPRGDDTFKGHLALLNHVTESRAREEAFRDEAEIMLEGLRVLLSAHTATQKLDELTSLAVRAIRGTTHAVFEIARDGRVRALGGASVSGMDGAALVELSHSAKSTVSVHRNDGPHFRVLRTLLGAKALEIALISLPVAGDSMALLCAPQSNAGFRLEDVGLASRFGLILQQALLLKEEQEKLIQSARLSALGQMSASLAHELRQPLNTISLTAQNLELLAENGPVPVETLSTKVTRIRDQVDRAAKIMDRVRRFSRKKGEPLVKVDLDRLVDGVRMLVEPDLVAVGVRLIADVPQGLSAHCDAIQIEQVLTNLVRNAKDVLMGIGTTAKTENGVVTIRGRALESGVALRVEDNGPGFPKDVASRPLETFYTSKGAEAGTGLGLSICHMIAREHAGSLEIGNHSGGAFVELRLPARTSAEQS